VSVRVDRTWADVLVDCAPEVETAERLVRQLRACEVSALAFCRLLERWARGDAAPSTPGGRQAALRRAAARTETALASSGFWRSSVAREAFFSCVPTHGIFISVFAIGRT